MWPYASRGSRFVGDVSEISPSALEHEDFSNNAVSHDLSNSSGTIVSTLRNFHTPLTEPAQTNSSSRALPPRARGSAPTVPCPRSPQHPHHD